MENGKMGSKTKKRIFGRLAAFLVAAAAVIGILSAVCVYADENSTSELFDDFADFSKIAAKSEGLVIDIVTEENKYAFGGDDTHLIRVTSDAEWIEYELPQEGYPIFNAAYAPNEAVSHFTFEYTLDGENYKKINPIITTDSVSGKWIPVHYSLKKLPEDAKKIKITFGNVGGTPWSPCLESAELKSRTTDDIGFSDCIGTNYYDATAKLKNLDLVSGYDNSRFNPKGTITRSEFASMISKLLALNETVNPENFKKVFSDVDPDYWGAGAIYALYSLGVVNGDEKGNFCPEENITLKDATKIMVSSLGYTAYALDRGGYPEGFIREAARLSLLDGLGSDYDSPLIRGDAALLMNNALDISVVTQNIYGESGAYSYGSETILGRYHNIVTYEGEVTDVGSASVYAENNTSGNRFMLGDKIYQSGDFDMLPYLGIQGTVYLKENGSEYTAVYFEKSSGTDVIDLDFCEYDGFDDGVVYFTKDGREQRRKLSDDTKVIYNYQYLTRVGLLNDEELPFGCGFMKIISNPDGGDYLMIYDFDTYIPTSSVRLGGVINDKNTGAVNLNLADAEAVMVRYDGDRTEYSPGYMLSDGSVVNVARSSDGKIVDIRISVDTATGYIEKVNPTENEYIIDGQAYSASEYFKTGNYRVDPSRGEITAYLDINGNIADIVGTVSDLRYGYLESVDSSGDPFSDSVLLRIVTETGKAEILIAKSSSILNGERFSLDKFSTLTPGLVKFSSEEDGTISELLTATDAIGIPNGERFSRNYVSESSKYYDGLNVFASKYQLDSATKVFIIPSGASDIFDVTKYRVTDKSELLSDMAYNTEIFDLSDEYVAGAVVIKSDDAGTVYNYSPVFVVENAGIFVGDDGLTRLSLTGYVNGESRELQFDPEGATDVTGSWLPDYTERSTKDGENPFSPGEVFQFSERDGVCRGFRMLLTEDIIETGVYYEKNLGDYGPLTDEQYYSELYTAFGTVNNRFSNKCLLSPGDGEILRTIPSGGSVYVYNKSTKKLYAGDATDIEQGSDIFTEMRLGATNITIVIR